ncbi:PTS sugar transporter subunit IIC [Erysipelothrix larvae]|nr:PTS transporter subunit EIIC [Erysipelothrix larvae]
MKDKLMNGLLRVASALQTNRYMVAIKNSFTALLPIIIGGAFFMLILNVVLSTTTTGMSLAKVNGFSWLSSLEPMFNAANYATMQFFAISLVVLISIELAQQYDRNETIVPAVALACYISLCLTSTTVTSSTDEIIKVANVLPREFTNAQGLFMAMITSIASTELYCRLVNGKKFEISMPESVPSNVTKAFNVLIPSILTILAIAGFGQLFEVLTGYTFFNAIAVFIQAPLKGILTGLPGYLFLFFMSTLLWVMGIHGTQVLKPVYEATMLLALAENLDKVLANEAPTNILNSVFISSFTTITGAGITAGLIISILLFSKREDYRAIAKLSIVPGIFNINETMTFGLPIVLNPILAIPFMLAPIVSATIGYTLTTIGFAIPMSYNIPWTTPALIGAFIGSGGHIGTVITQFLAIASSVLVYTPFVLISNKQKPEDEAAIEG